MIKAFIIGTLCVYGLLTAAADYVESRQIKQSDPTPKHMSELIPPCDIEFNLGPGKRGKLKQCQ